MSGYGNHDAFLIHALAFKAQFNPQLSGGHFHKLAHGILHAGGNHEIFRLVLLQHHPLHPDVIFGMPPVTQRIHIAQVQARLQPLRDVGDRTRNFARDKGFAAARRFVVKQNAVTGIHTVRFAVVDGYPVGVQLSNGIRRARVERRALFLRDFLYQTVQFRGGSLIKTGLLFQAEEADSFQQTQGADSIDIRGVFR